MWNTLSKFFGLVSEEEGTSTDKTATGAEESSSASRQREWKEFNGIVTSLHSSYGLIDNEVYFTHDVVAEGILPRVGDTVHVKASRKHQVAGWKAEFVSRVNASRSWDNDWEEGEEEEGDEVDEEEGGSEARTEESRERLEKARRLREKRAVEKAALVELLADKMDVSVTKLLDFGQMEIGKTKSLKLEIKNNGATGQTLCGWMFKSKSVSSQFELSPIRLLSIDLKQSSRKAQETLPMTLDPGKAAMVTVYCNAQYMGLDQQIVVFEFEGFTIGRRIEVTVLDLTQLELQPVVPYQKSQAVGRYQQTKEAWIVPGQRPNWGHSGAKIPKRLPQHPVPEYVRKCILEQRDVATVLPVLVKPLLLENYATRFSALLFLEEIQQEIDIREFDLDTVSLRVAGEFLALGIPGLAEGRPSLLIGDRAILSEPEESVLAPSYEGIVHEVLKDEVLLKFCEDFHNSYTAKEYNVRFVFSRTNFRRCHTAAEYASRRKNNILFPRCLDVKMSQMLSSSAGGSLQKAMATVVKVGPTTGIKRCPARPRAKEIYAGHVFFNDLLNSRQRSAVFRVLQGQGRPTPYIIFGPPGTGKTVTVVECILQIFYHLHNGCILACTPSNSAADLLTERLHQSGLVHVSDMVRVNAFQRGHENVVESVRPYCADVDDLDTIKTKRIVVCTCSTAGMFYGMDLPVSHFSHVFVDEAGQATEPECMIPVGLVTGNDGQIVLAGDPLQLGPVLRSNVAKDYGLQTSYLERLSRLPIYTRDASKFVSHGSYDPLLVTKLVENYRSHPALLNLSSEIFYDGELVIAADKNLVDCLCSWEHLPNKDSFPVLFHGIRGEDLREGNSPSWFNPQEAIQVMKYLQSVVHNEMYRLTYDDVGIITPYRKQVEKIRLLIDRLGMEKVKVGSVEEFQGQERLVMIISTVRSTESLVSVDLRYTLGFLSNPKRFNVSITRAHALLIIVGNPHVLSQDFYWCKLLQYCVANNAYVGCDLPEIGHLKSRTHSRWSSGDTGSSSKEGEVDERSEGHVDQTENLKSTDDFSGVTGNVSESTTGMSAPVSCAVSVTGDITEVLKVCFEEPADVDFVPSASQNFVETEKLGVCAKEDVASHSSLPHVDNSASTFGNDMSADVCNDTSEVAREEKLDAGRSVLNTETALLNKTRDVVNRGFGNTTPASRDSLNEPTRAEHQTQMIRVNNEEEFLSSEALVTDNVSQNPADMDTSNIVEVDSKTETYRNSPELSVEPQECVGTSEIEIQKPRLDLQILTDSKDPSNSGHISKFVDCDTRSAAAGLTCSSDSINLADKMDVEVDPSAIDCDENVLEYATDAVLRSRISTMEENPAIVSAELSNFGVFECRASRANDESVRTDITDMIKFDAADVVLAADKRIASELEISECRQQLTDPFTLEKERTVFQAVDTSQGRERTCVEDFKPDAICASAAASCSIASVKLNLAIEEGPCHAPGKGVSTDRRSWEGVKPSHELAKAFTYEDRSASQNYATTGKELRFGLTDFTGAESKNISSPRLGDCDSSKLSLESSFGEPLRGAESSEQLEDVFQYDGPNSGDRSLFNLAVLNRDIESRDTSSISLDVCAPDSISSVHTLCDDSLCEKFTSMRIGDSSLEPCSYVDESVSAVDCAEENPTVGDSYYENDLSEVSVGPVQSTEAFESNVVDGERARLKSVEDYISHEDARVLDPSDVVETVNTTRLFPSDTEQTQQFPQLDLDEGSSETLVPAAQTETCKMESKTNESAGPPDYYGKLTRDTILSIGNRLTTATGNDFETIGSDCKKFLEDCVVETDIMGIPVKGSTSEPSLGVSVPHSPDSHLPAKSASQTATTEMGTERNLPYSSMTRGFYGQRRRGSFDRGAARHSFGPFDRRGQGRGFNSPGGRFQAGRGTDDVPFSGPDSSGNLSRFPDRPYGMGRGQFLCPAGAEDVNDADMVRGNRGNEEIDGEDPFSEESSEMTTCGDFKKSVVSPDRRRTGESGGRRNFRDARRNSSLESDEKDSHVDTEKKIVHQMEYYFGDFNLMRDGFLQDQIARDIDGWVDLSVIVTFNRMKALTTNFEVICDALRKSTSGVVEVSDDNTKVRRSSQKPLNNDMESWLKDLKTRAAVIKNYPSSETIDNMQSFFETYGGVAHIERGINKRSYHRGSSGGRPGYELVDLVIFLSEDGLKNLAKRRYTTLKRMGLAAWFTDELSDQCVDYFYKRRVQCIPKQNLPPVGFSGSLGDVVVQKESAADGAKSQQNRNRPYQSSSLQSQKFRSHTNSTSQHSGSSDDHRLRGSVSDGRVGAKSTDGEEEGVTKIRPLMEDELELSQLYSTGHRTPYRRSSNHQFSNRSYSDSSNTYQKAFDHEAFSEPRTMRKPLSPGDDLELSEGKRDIDKLLSNIDNMSFSRRKPCSPTHQSSPSKNPNNRVNVMMNRDTVGFEPFVVIPSPQQLDLCRQDLPRKSRKVKCFDPEFSFELTPSSSAGYDRRASENGLHVASNTEANFVPRPRVSLSPSHGIPEMNLISLATGVDDWSSGQVQGQLQQRDVSTHDNSCSSMMLDSQVYEVSDENLSYSMMSNQRDDDIIIESSCEEDLEEETSDEDNTKGGWEAK